MRTDVSTVFTCAMETDDGGVLPCECVYSSFDSLKNQHCVFTRQIFAEWLTAHWTKRRRDEESDRHVSLSLSLPVASVVPPPLHCLSAVHQRHLQLNLINTAEKRCDGMMPSRWADSLEEERSADIFLLLLFFPLRHCTRRTWTCRTETS